MVASYALFQVLFHIKANIFASQAQLQAQFQDLFPSEANKMAPTPSSLPRSKARRAEPFTEPDARWLGVKEGCPFYHESIPVLEQ